MTARATTIPASLTAGDTWEWERSLPDHPASDGWVPSYAIVGALKLTWDPAWATAEGALHVVTVPMAKTAELGAGGPVRFVEMVTLSGVRKTLGTFERVVAPDPAGYEAGDGISWARRMLKVVDDFLEGHLADGVQYQIIGTRQLQHIPLPELLQFRRDLKAQVAREMGRGNGPLGRPIRFTMPGVQ
jgi:hypothetical protein